MTYEGQRTLRKLPIPDLEKTCARYLEVLRPLQTEREHEQLTKAVAQFLQGLGPFLDAQLRKYSESRSLYIEQFWFDSYLAYDLPVVLNLNPFFLLEDDPFNNESTCADPQVKRAASLTLSALKFVRALKNETLPPDTTRDGKPLCMDQYTKLFGSARIPTESGCVMQLDPRLNHVVVASRLQFYWFEVLDDDNNVTLLEQELAANYALIVKDLLQAPANDVARGLFGVLTTENRRVWAKIRALPSVLNRSNSAILNVIDSALFVICLDHIALTDLSDLAKNMLCGLSVLDKGVQVGTCTNRWYDKLQIIVTKNGKAGINFEHTGVDGHTVLRFVLDVYTDSILSFAQLINSNAPTVWEPQPPPLGLGVTVPRKLEWDITPDLLLALRFGETRLSDLINQNEFRHLEFKGYGAATIKKMRFLPDAFVQMAFQAAYYALYGKVECTYEPAMTKHFLHGRTEAIRTVLNESNYFVRKFFDPNMDAASKLAFLGDACAKHSEQTRRCSAGEGVDRHLYALFCIWKRCASDEFATEMRQDDTITPEFSKNADSDSDSDHTVGNNCMHTQLGLVPELFADPGWDRLNETVLSTSNCGNPSLRLFGFGPVSANGFGIGYIIKDDLISICAALKHRQTSRFLVTLELYFKEVHRMWAAQAAGPKPVPAMAHKVAPAINTLLGGYGYFDMGDEDLKSRGPTPEPVYMPRLDSALSMRMIERKLRLSEY